MQTYEVIDDKSYSVDPQLSSGQVATEILTPSFSEGPTTITRMLMLYCWYTEGLKQQGSEFLEALLLAYEMQLPIQVKFNQQNLLSCITQDMATRYFCLAQQRLKYSGSISVQEHNHVNQTFHVPIPNLGNKYIKWVFYPIEQFNQPIPLHALKAMSMFRNEDLQPAAYWVADKVETIISTSTSKRLDPILCAQFGNWFAGIAMWL